MVGGNRKELAKANRWLRIARLWATLTATTLILGATGCARPPVGDPIPTPSDQSSQLSDPTIIGGDTSSTSTQEPVQGFSPADLPNTGFAVNVPQQQVLVPSMVRPAQQGLQLVNEFPSYPILVQNGILQTTVPSPNDNAYGAVHFRHSLYDVYLGMQVAVPQGYSNAITLMARHHVTPTTYGTRAHCYVGVRLNTKSMRVEVGEDIGGVWYPRGSRALTSLSGMLELIAYKSNFAAYYNGQIVGIAYSRQFQESNVNTALYGVNGQAFQAAKAVIANLYEASKKMEIPLFSDKFLRTAYGSPGLAYISPAGSVVSVANGALTTTSAGTRVPVLLDGTQEMRSQDVRADVTIGTLGQAGVVAAYYPNRGGYASFIDCNGGPSTCAIRSGYLYANGAFTEVQSKPFGGSEYPNIGFNFTGRAKIRMTFVRNHAAVVQVNVYLNEQLALAWQGSGSWINGNAGAYLMNGGAVNTLTVADHSQ